MAKTKRGKTKQNWGKNFLRELLEALNVVITLALIIILVLYFLTDYTLMPKSEYSSLIEKYLHLTKELALYMHYQLTLPFLGCFLAFIFLNYKKQ